jgi:hypothetical protein
MRTPAGIDRGLIVTVVTTRAFDRRKAPIAHSGRGTSIETIAEFSLGGKK